MAHWHMGLDEFCQQQQQTSEFFLTDSHGPVVGGALQGCLFVFPSTLANPFPTRVDTIRHHSMVQICVNL